ncbi:uncharacterized protein I206_100707 [Kwoniella pini CBS 10737]|uniref:Glycosyl hydrolase family 88 n=1 Tax=Kwoniella pini CBS 10737 TaxID=1296096 RepID=A0A1B9ICF2_9TREE|nr:uncharacterized protein I206_00620 [Kwoniella pini CBS 10737]OCF53318.1 hypothetical protein I206_00620 [Kwoniella pini CBS 10737]
MSSGSNLTSAVKELYDPALSVKVVGVAKKYDTDPNGPPPSRTPEYTKPGGPNNYHCSKNVTAWTQGFFPGTLWLLAERADLDPSSIDSHYTKEDLIRLARRWQADFKYQARPSPNHDQGFRFQLSYGKDYAMTGDEEAKEVLIDAAESLVDRYNPNAGCIRSWDSMTFVEDGYNYTEEKKDQHYLVIIDNMMNLDLLYEATKLTGDERYAKVATHQAEKSLISHVRKDFTTYHVANFDQKTGLPIQMRTAQGYADESVWSRGQAWAIYGYGQCALRTGRRDFIDTARKLTDVFLSLLGPSGVPEWDFRAPKPCPYDASAGTIAAVGMLWLYKLLQPTDKTAAEGYLNRAVKLIQDTIRECLTPQASLKANGETDFGKDGWETLLAHSTIVGNPKSVRRLMDHGLVYADYYLVEFSNQLLKIQQGK